MQRPIEYENLIKTRALESVAPTPGAVERYLLNAKNYLDSAKQIDQKLSLQVFTAAYEGYFQLVNAFLECYQVRTKESGRNLVIQKVAADLKMSTIEQASIIRAHERRNSTSYRSPFPPVSAAEAASLVAILGKYLAVATEMLRDDDSSDVCKKCGHIPCSCGSVRPRG
jgi:hypothetical protein